MPKLRQYLPKRVQILSQGDIVANRLTDYLHRHPEIETLCSKNGQRRFLTTDSTTLFDRNSCHFFGQPVKSELVQLEHGLH
jgi:glutamate racemase